MKGVDVRWQSLTPNSPEFRAFQREVYEPQVMRTGQLLSSHLTDEQQQRLRQIALQQRGWKMLVLRSVQAELGLSRGQMTALKDLIIEHTQRDTQLRRKMQTDATFRVDLRALTNWCETKSRRLLTDRQRQRLDQLRGPASRVPSPHFTPI